MAKYRALSDIWLGHENRLVRSGETFDTTFPLIDGKPMRIGSNLEILQDTPAEGRAKKGKAIVQDTDSVDDLV